MIKFTRENAKKYIEKELKKADKIGLDISKITEGKSIDKLSHNSTTLNNFKKRMKRQKERPKLIAENIETDKRLATKRKERENKKFNREYERAIKKGNISNELKEKREKMLKENAKDFKRNFISDPTKAIVKFNLNIEPTKHNIAKVTKLEADKFFDKYFKSVRGDVALEKKIDNLKNRFGNRLDLLHEFINKVTAIDFHYEIDGMVFDRGQFESDFAENWNDMMESRLDKMFSLLNKKEFNI